MNLTDELERSIPDGPPLPAVVTRLAAGQAALRRRRRILAAAAAAGVAAMVVPFALASDSAVTRGADPSPPPIVGTPSPPVPGRTLASTQAADYPWRPGELVAADRSSELLIRPGAVVLERRDDLYPGKDTQSVALDLRFRGERHWVVLEWAEDGSASGYYGGPDASLFDDFDDFVVKATSDGGMTSGPVRSPGSGSDTSLEPVALPWLSVNGQRFVAEEPGRIVEQRADLDFPENFAPAGTPTAAALVEEKGVRYLALFRGPDSDMVIVDATGQGGTLGALLEWARGRYASGAGLL